MAEVLSFSINAGENKNYEMAGGYVEILETSSPIEIILYNNEGGISDILKGVESGIFCAKTFKRFNVTSATAQNVKLFISDGSAGSRRQPGVVKVKNEISQTAEIRQIGINKNQIALFNYDLIVDPGNNYGVTVNSVAMNFQTAGKIYHCIIASKNPPTALGTQNEAYLISRTVVINESKSIYQELQQKSFPVGWKIYSAYSIETDILQDGIIYLSWQINN